MIAVYSSSISIGSKFSRRLSTILNGKHSTNDVSKNNDVFLTNTFQINLIHNSIFIQILFFSKMASTEETSTNSENIPPSSGNDDEKKSSPNNDKDSGFECNVSSQLEKKREENRR